MSEWLKETGCKPVGYAYAGSNPAPATSSDLAQGRKVVVVEDPVGGRRVRLDLLGLRGARDDRRDARCRRERRDRELEHGMAALAREGLQRLDAVERLGGEALGAACEAGALRRVLAAAELPGEQAAREREVGDEAELELAHERKDLPLGLAFEQAVLVLDRGEPVVAGAGGLAQLG